MIDAAMLKDMRSFIKRRIGYLSYDNVHRVPIDDVQILSSGVVRVQATIRPETDISIKRIGIYSNSGELWAHQDVDITMTKEQTGVLYRFDFTIKEETEYV